MQRDNRTALSGAGTGRACGERLSDQGDPTDPGRFEQIGRCWEGQTVAVIASGPSAQEQDVRQLRRRCDFVLCVNNALSLFPNASALYACDTKWWDNNRHIWEPFSGLKFTYSDEPARRGWAIKVPSENGDGIGLHRMRKGGWRSMGGNGGFQAMNLAVLLGANRIVLYGYDMQRTGGQTHFHGDHRHTSNPGVQALRDWASAFDAAYQAVTEAGVELINASRETAIKAIPRVAVTDL